MNVTRKRLWRAAAVGGGVVSAAAALVAAALADQDEHETAPHKPAYVHRIRLLDAERNPIDADSSAPYSPRQTCSGPECHSYEAVAQGMHFDMGKRLMADDWGMKHRGEPWHLSPGMAGGFLPTFRRQFARKQNASAAEIDLTAYEFVQACGTCHPGGGVLETDRDGKRYDAVMKADKDRAESLDGDYHKARWHLSGVVEIDCLLCHLQTPYNNDERVAQLGYQNYAFAATAAARFGIVRGKVAEATDEEAEYDPANPVDDSAGQPPAAIDYDRRLFDSQGYVTLDIGQPQDRACLLCHHVPQLKDGERFKHRHSANIHIAQGLACVDCHSGDEGHDFELGRKLHYSVGGHGATGQEHQGEHEQAMSCEECHEASHLGAPLPRHTGFPRFHFERLACTACHTGPALLVKERGTEPVISDLSASTPQTAGHESAYPDQQSPWQIAYHERGGQLRVHNCQPPRWWGNRLDDGSVWPLFPREVAPAFKAAAGQIQDDDGDGTPEVNTGDEIRAMDAALRAVLDGGRFGAVQPAFVMGPHALWVEGGQVKHAAVAQSQPLCVTIGHTVLGPQQALGAGGCTDCHATDSYFLCGQRVLNDLNSEGKAKTEPMHARMGYPRTRIRLGALRERWLKPIALLLIPLTVVACLLHYVLFGPKRIRRDDPDDQLPRFTTLERAAHLLQMLGFLVLAASGVGFLLASRLRDAVSHVWTTDAMECVHATTGYVFIATSLVLLLRWLPPALFRRYDLQWLRVMGGYLWMKGEAPAGKFNAGQKMLFWLLAAACLALGTTGLVMALRPASLAGWLGWAYFVHDLAAALVIPAILGHIYLGTLANPGTLRAIFDGSVTRPWAAAHHPNWLAEAAESKGEDA